MMTDVSNDAPLSLDGGVSWMLKVALDWFFAGLTPVEQNGVWQLHLGWLAPVSRSTYDSACKFWWRYLRWIPSLKSACLMLPRLHYSRKPSLPSIVFCLIVIVWWMVWNFIYSRLAIAWSKVISTMDGNTTTLWLTSLPLHRMEASSHANWMLQGHGMIPHWHIGDPCIRNFKNVGKITVAKCWWNLHLHLTCTSLLFSPHRMYP